MVLPGPQYGMPVSLVPAHGQPTLYGAVPMQALPPCTILVPSPHMLGPVVYDAPLMPSHHALNVQPQPYFQPFAQPQPHFQLQPHFQPQPQQMHAHAYMQQQAYTHGQLRALTLSDDHSAARAHAGSVPPRPRLTRARRGLSDPPLPSYHVFSQPYASAHYPNVPAGVGPDSVQYRRSESWQPSPASSTRSSRGDEGALFHSRMSSSAAPTISEAPPAAVPLSVLTLNEPLRTRLHAFDESQVGRVRATVTGTPQQDCVCLSFTNDRGQIEELTIRKLSHTVILNATMETTPSSAWAADAQAAATRIVESTQLIQQAAERSLRSHDWFGASAFVYDGQFGTGTLRQLLQCGPSSDSEMSSVRSWPECQHTVPAHLACMRSWALGADPVNVQDAGDAASPAHTAPQDGDGPSDPANAATATATATATGAAGGASLPGQAAGIASAARVFAEPCQPPTEASAALMPATPLSPQSRQPLVPQSPAAARSRPRSRGCASFSPIPPVPKPPSPPPRRSLPHPCPCDCGRPARRHEHECACFRSLTASMAVLRKIEPAVRRSRLGTKGRVSVFHMLLASGLDSIESAQHTLTDVRHWLENPNIQGYHLFLSPLTPPGHPGYQALLRLKEESPPHVSRRITFLGPDSTALDRTLHAIDLLRYSILLEFKIYGPPSTSATPGLTASQQPAGPPPSPPSAATSHVADATTAASLTVAPTVSGLPASAGSRGAQAVPGAVVDSTRPRFAHSATAEQSRDHCESALRELIKHAVFVPAVLPAVVDLIAQHFFPAASG
jgi:hypothetical protein